MAIGSLALEFFNNEAVINEKGVGKVTQKKYLEFAQSQGVTKEMIEKMEDFNKELTNGAYLFCDKNLQSDIAAAKKSKADPALCKTGVSVNIPNGQFEMTLSAAKKYHIPKQPGEFSIKTNVCNMQFVQHRLLDKDTLASCEEATKKALGL